MIRNEAPDYGKQYTPAEYEATFERIGGMDVREVTIAKVLQEQGYRTGIFGKWDLGSLQRYLPQARGFEQFYGFVNTGIDYYTHERYGVPSMYRNTKPTTEDRGIYCTELFEREALRFLHQHAGKHPFFLYLPFNAPHGSSALAPEIRSTVQAPEEFKKQYPPVQQEFKMVEKYRYASPARVATRAAKIRNYRAAVTCMDASIGKVLDLLDTKGELENTIVIFFSDNGGSGGADNSPLRGHKSQVWEGGLRVPCLVRWPAGKIPAGTVNHEFLTSLEIFRSLLTAARIQAPKHSRLDGYDWWGTLRNENPSPRTAMFWKRRDLLAARVDQWKWVDMGGKSGGLFNLATDPGETSDLSSQYPDIVKMVKTRFADWQKQMKAAEPRGPFRDY